MDTIKTAKDLMNKYSEKSTTQNNKKIHPALAAGKETERGYILEILNIVKSIFNLTKSIFQRQAYIKADTENILRSLNNFNSLNIPCQIPSMTPKQLYLCYKGGWTIRQLSGLSGLDEMVIKTKIENYRQNNT